MKDAFSSKNITLYLKGFAMGTADIVPGVSGGTVALITGVYDELIKTVSSFDHKFLKILLHFNLKKILSAMNIKFLLPLGLGIVSALLLMSRVMHYLMENYAVYTWSLFFGLILASILFLLKKIGHLKTFKCISSILLGTLIGYLVVSIIPMNTSNSYGMVFLSGLVAICAMVLPGISGSFILLILGKYFFITSMLKNLFVFNNLIYIFIFCLGCGTGIITFSKLIKYLLEKYYTVTICILIGFMIGSLKKIWPWRTIEDARMISGKLKVISEGLFVPETLNSEVFFALIIMIIGFASVFIIERQSKS